jgi:hypothetical protein
MLSAAQVQTLIGAKDGQIVAHGYTLDRYTVDVWFEQQQIVRREYQGAAIVGTPDDHEVGLLKSFTFEPDYFFANIKRWYRDETSDALADYFATFGRPLPLI